MSHKKLRSTSRVPAVESHRLVESLQAAGWPLSWVERKFHLPPGSLSDSLRQRQITVVRRDQIRMAWLALRAVEPPETTHEERTAVSAARSAGRRHSGVLPGDLPPVPWEA